MVVSRTRRDRTGAVPKRRRWRHDWTPDLLLAPALIAVAAVMGFPLVYLLYMSLHKWALIGYAPPEFLGAANFTGLLDDDRFTNSLWRTLYFTALGLVTNIPPGLAIALLLNREFLGRNLLRALLIFPMVATPVAMGRAWVLMLDPPLGIVRYL